jgi:hypothetical protein
VGAAIAWLRGPALPFARSLADDGGPLLRPLDVAAIGAPDRQLRPLGAIVENDRELVLRLAECHDTLPSVGRPDAEEIAGVVERHAAATWGAWVAGTGEPAWPALPERVRDRLRAAVRAGLAASGLLP